MRSDKARGQVVKYFTSALAWVGGLAAAPPSASSATPTPTPSLTAHPHGDNWNDPYIPPHACYATIAGSCLTTGARATHPTPTADKSPPRALKPSPRGSLPCQKIFFLSVGDFWLDGGGGVGVGFAWGMTTEVIRA